MWKTLMISKLAAAHLQNAANPVMQSAIMSKHAEGPVSISGTYDQTRHSTTVDASSLRNVQCNIQL
jgi:hypothetical protein